MTSPIKMQVTRTAASDLLDVPSSELRSVFGNRRSLPLDEFVSAYITDLSTAPEEVGEMRDDAEVQNRELLVAGAAVRELRAELIDGQSYRQTEVEDVVGFRLAAVVGRFNHLGAKLATQLLNRSSQEVAKILEAGCSECTEELVDFEGRDFACPKLYWESEQEGNSDGTD